MIFDFTTRWSYRKFYTVLIPCHQRILISWFVLCLPFSSTLFSSLQFPIPKNHKPSGPLKSIIFIQNTKKIHNPSLYLYQPNLFIMNPLNLNSNKPSFFLSLHMHVRTFNAFFSQKKFPFSNSLMMDSIFSHKPVGSSFFINQC